MTGAQLKDIRLNKGIGSKWLKQAIATKHPEVLEHQNFVHDVEYGRVTISPEVETTWMEMCSTTIPPTLQNTCDLCGNPTGSWLHDICTTCITSAILRVGNKYSCQ